MKKCLGRYSLFAMIILFFSQPVQSQIVITTAGNGTFGTSGLGGPATVAELGNVNYLAFDPMGNCYIVDPPNYRIVRKDAVTGILTLFAGNGTQGSSGNGGLAALAEFMSIGDIVADSSNLYIADIQGNEIWRVNFATNIITTFAGTGNGGFNGNNQPAATAQLFRPTALALDRVRKLLYVSDIGNNMIRAINLMNDSIALFAGNGTPGFYGDGVPAITAELSGPIGGPQGLAVDDSGNVYISDSRNFAIRKVDIVTGIITTIAGTGVAGTSADSVPAITAALNYPVGIKVGHSGDIYFSESVNSFIRKIIGATGMLVTITGTGTTGWNGDSVSASLAEIWYPCGLELDPCENIYFADPDNYRVREINYVADHYTYGKTTADTIPKGSFATVDSFVTIRFDTLPDRIVTITDSVLIVTHFDTMEIIKDSATFTVTHCINTDSNLISGYTIFSIITTLDTESHSSSDTTMISGLEKTFHSEIKVYPNPFTNEFTISVGEPSDVTLIDELGRIILQATIAHDAILKPDVSKGTYFLKITDQDHFQKVIKLVSR